MRNRSKTSELESKFPLLAIEGGCIVSKDADVTVAFALELPELFTLTSPEYEMMHAAWKVAASAALVEGRKPQPRRFISLAKETTVRFVVVEQAAERDLAPPAAMKGGEQSPPHTGATP